MPRVFPLWEPRVAKPHYLFVPPADIPWDDCPRRGVELYPGEPKTAYASPLGHKVYWQKKPVRASTDMLIYLGDVFQPLFCDVVGCAAVRFRRAEYHARRGFKRSDWYTVYLRRPVPGELLLTAESEFNAVLVVQEHHSGLHFRQGVRIVRVEQDALYMSGWDPWDSAPPSVGTDVELDGPWRFTQLELKGWCEAKHRRLPVGRLKNFSREAATPEGRVRVMQRLLTHPSFSWGYELQPFLVPPQPRRARDSRGRSQ